MWPLVKGFFNLKGVTVYTLRTIGLGSRKGFKPRRNQ